MDSRLMNLAQEQAQYCQVFSNAKRIMILWVLGKNEKSVSDIASEVDASLQNTSQHLRLMRDRGILGSRREGNTIFYRIVNNECLKNQNPFIEQQLLEENKH
ncbi:MAG: ArsR/SmtB family transcription factor [Anaerolineales bacterium]